MKGPCLTCGLPVKHAGRKYHAACVPRAIRSAAGKKARRNVAYRQRSMRFHLEFARFFSSGRIVTKELIIDFGDALYRRGFQSGYSAAIGRGEWDRARTNANLVVGGQMKETA